MKWNLIGFVVLTVLLKYIQDNEAKITTEHSSQLSEMLSSNSLHQGNENIETIKEMDLTAEQYVHSTNAGDNKLKQQQQQMYKNVNSVLTQQQQPKWILQQMPKKSNNIAILNETKDLTTRGNLKKLNDIQATKTIEIIYIKPKATAIKKQIANNNTNNNNNQSNKNNNVVPHAKSQPLSFVNPFGQLVSFFGSDHLGTLQDYNFLFYAERHTIFQLHTQAESGRVFNVVSDTIGAAFGVNRANTPTVPTNVEEVQLYNAASLRKSKFNPFNPTRILIHGWMGNSNAGIYNILIPEYLQASAGNYNIFTVDWGRGAFADYITASYRVKPVGKVLAKFIDFLHREAGTLFADIQLVGFSMGAHIAGIAGKFVQAGRIPVIYALDPALPLFRYDNVEERVAITDADYLEVIHTSAGSYGYDMPLGHVDFYMNFGSNQPGCFFNECSHFRAFQFFGESLRKQHNFELRGEGCDVALWQDLIRYRRCLRTTARTLTMDGDIKNATVFRQRRGLYYLTTNAAPPYGKPKPKPIARGKRAQNLVLNKNIKSKK